MIIGVGVDIVEVRRINRSLSRFGDRFLNKILSQPELRPELEGGRLSAYVAKQFAAKEAVSKALGTGMGAGVSFTSIQILRSDYGAPYVTLTDKAAKRAERIGAHNIQVSLSDEKEYAIAYVVAASE